MGEGPAVRAGIELPAGATGIFESPHKVGGKRMCVAVCDGELRGLVVMDGWCDEEYACDLMARMLPNQPEEVKAAIRLLR